MMSFSSKADAEEWLMATVSGLFWDHKLGCWAMSRLIRDGESDVPTYRVKRYGNGWGIEETLYPADEPQIRHRWRI